MLPKRNLQQESSWIDSVMTPILHWAQMFVLRQGDCKAIKTLDFSLTVCLLFLNKSWMQISAFKGNSWICVYLQEDLPYSGKEATICNIKRRNSRVWQQPLYKPEHITKHNFSAVSRRGTRQQSQEGGSGNRSWKDCEPESPTWISLFSRGPLVQRCHFPEGQNKYSPYIWVLQKVHKITESKYTFILVWKKKEAHSFFFFS